MSNVNPESVLAALREHVAQHGANDAEMHSAVEGARRLIDSIRTSTRERFAKRPRTRDLYLRALDIVAYDLDRALIYTAHHRDPVRAWNPT